MKIIKFTIIFSAIAIFLAIGSAILFLIDCDLANCVSILATVISVVLSFVSIVYTYISGKETLKTLQKMEGQNQRFINKITLDILKENFNQENLKDARLND